MEHLRIYKNQIFEHTKNFWTERNSQKWDNPDFLENDIEMSV